MVFTWKSKAYLKILRLELSDLTQLKAGLVLSLLCGKRLIASLAYQQGHWSIRHLSTMTFILTFTGSLGSSLSGYSSGTSTGHVQWWINRALGRETGTEYGWMNKWNYGWWREIVRTREKWVPSTTPSKSSFFASAPHPPPPKQQQTVEGRIFYSAVTFLIHMNKKSPTEFYLDIIIPCQVPLCLLIRALYLVQHCL